MTNIELKEMADRIKTQRKKLSYTQERFCEILDISVSSYAKIENAFQKPSLDTLVKISKNLGVSLDYLVFGTDAAQTENHSNSQIMEQILSNMDKDKLQYAIDFLNQINSLK